MTKCLPFRALLARALAAIILAAASAVSVAINNPQANGSGFGGLGGSSPVYLTDAAGQLVYVTGSHTWSNLQETWGENFPVIFDFDAYLDLLVEHNHNFIRLWRLEMPKYRYPDDPGYYYTWPHPWVRTGPGRAGDGDPKFDLTVFDEAYFNRLRDRCVAAGDRGIYVSVMLFEGHGLQETAEGWFSHPFNLSNNVNGINGDPDGDNRGLETHTLAIPEVVALQETYVKKVIDTVNDLDNIVYEIANESHGDSIAWQNYMIDFIHAYEAGKPKQHLVNFSSPLGNYNTALFKSNAEIVSPWGSQYLNDPPANTSGKIILADSDHLMGCGSNIPWIWKAFTRGHNPIYMDSYYPDVPYCLPPDPDMRVNMGYARSYAERLDLQNVEPLSGLASSEYCLADPGAAYLVYLPEGGLVSVNLIDALGTLSVEWFNPATGEATSSGSVDGGGLGFFTAPFDGHAVLFLFKLAKGPTDSDVNQDGTTNIDDLFLLIAHWGPCIGCASDLNGDGVVDAKDLAIIIDGWT